MTENHDDIRKSMSMDTSCCRRTPPARNREYELLLKDYLRLYDELEDTRNAIALLISDITMTVEYIRDSFEDIDQSMEACTRRLRSLKRDEAYRKSVFQGSIDIPGTKAVREETRAGLSADDISSAQTL